MLETAIVLGKRFLGHNSRAWRGFAQVARCVRPRPVGGWPRRRVGAL